MTELLSATAFTLWGSPATWAELVAFVLALAMVVCNMREIHWGWPLAMASSLVYIGVFWRSRLYGDAALQVFFVVVSLWGWWQWLRGRRSGTAAAAAPEPAHAAGTPALRIARLSPRGLAAAVLAAALAWPAVGWFLARFTDTDVPWWDAFPTALSLVGQVLLGRKLLENWAVWLAVNVVGAALFAWKGLWLTALLYTLFAALSVAGWRAWQLRLGQPA